MSELNCETVIGAIQRDYGALWHCVRRGNTLEIVTPYLYPDKGFVSAFVTERGKKIVVSDGGGLTDFVRTAGDDEAFESAVLTRFTGSYGVRAVVQAGRQFYFKECDAVGLVPSAIFDLCNFVVAVSSAAIMTLTEEETAERESFRSKADQFIKLRVQPDRTVQFNQSLPEVPEATFSAVIGNSSRLWLVFYLTGSNLNYFTRSVSNAIINVEFARESKLKNHIAATVPLINNQAVGYQPAKLQHRFERLKQVAQCDAISWTDRESIDARLAV